MVVVFRSGRMKATWTFRFISKDRIYLRYPSGPGQILNRLMKRSDTDLIKAKKMGHFRPSCNVKAASDPFVCG